MCKSLWRLLTISLRLGMCVFPSWHAGAGSSLGAAGKRRKIACIAFNLQRGNDGTAFITDSGAGGIVVVHLASGESWRQLDLDVGSDNERNRYSAGDIRTSALSLRRAGWQRTIAPRCRGLNLGGRR